MQRAVLNEHSRLYTGLDRCNSFMSLWQLLSVDKQAGKIYLFTGEGLRVSFHRANRSPSGDGLLHVEGHFSFQSLLAVALSADSAITRLCVVYD